MTSWPSTVPSSIVNVALSVSAPVCTTVVRAVGVIVSEPVGWRISKACPRFTASPLAVAAGSVTGSAKVAPPQLGTGGTLDAAGLIPIIPEASQEQLNNYLLTLTTSAPAPVSSDTSITFSANLLTTQGNGAGISEGALFTASGVMFNYLTFPAIQKTASFGINFQWTIST